MGPGPYQSQALGKESLANAEGGDGGWGTQVLFTYIIHQLASPSPGLVAHKARYLLVLANTWGQGRFHSCLLR